jgi:hypothetical protein
LSDNFLRMTCIEKNTDVFSFLDAKMSHGDWVLARGLEVKFQASSFTQITVS